MTIIAFISQKGGVGKSTLAQALASEASKQKLKTLLADYDPQQKTSLEWSQRRNVDNKHSRRAKQKNKYLTVNSFATFKEIIQQEKFFNLLIIDGPARTSQGTLEIAKQANLVIQPTGASLADLKPSVNEFHALVKAGINKQKLVFVLNHLATKSEEGAAREYLTMAGYSVLNHALKEKASYRLIQNEGKSISEVSYKSLRKEAKELVKEIIIIETNRPQKIKNFLDKEHFSYKVYQKPNQDKEQLKKLDCNSNKLTNLDLVNLEELEYLNCSDNQLIQLNLSQQAKLEELYISKNNFFAENPTWLSHLVSLKELDLTENNFTSLEFTKTLTALEKLNIFQTPITTGLEYLPQSLKEIKCEGKLKNELVLYNIIYGKTTAKNPRKLKYTPK